MGKQSARMWFDEYDHKDIYFDGHYHKQMYLSDENANLTLLWEKLADIDGFKFVLKTSEAAIFKAKGNFTVNWGNGKTEEYSLSELSYVSTYYENPTTNSYAVVTISGNLLDISFEQTPGLTEILTPFPKTMYAKEDFTKCFYECLMLTDIPEDLFVNCPNATNFTAAFYHVRNINIPEKLFSTCFNATHFNTCFAGIWTGVPEKLFENCVNATYFNACFRDTRFRIPDNLFAKNKKATNFRMCFYNSTTGDIPSNLFGNNENLENVENCFGFCSNLTAIPADIFDGCPNITNFNSTFYNCQNVTSAVPELWNRTNVTEHENCFGYCINAENHDDIPSSWR